MAIFVDMVEKCIEVFIDDFSVFGASFENCLSNLEKVLQRCEESNLVLNWEKCHFMVQEGIMLGHKISRRGIEVDKAKIDVMMQSYLPRVLDRRLQEAWARATKEGPRVLVNLRIDF